MSNQAEPTNNTTNLKVRTEIVGVADTNVKDLGGLILNQKDINTATTKILIAAGIPKDAIRCIRVGCDPERKLRIFAEIWKKMINQNDRYDSDEDRPSASVLSFDDVDEEAQEKSDVFPKGFYNVLKNKVYYKHLDHKTILRNVKINKGKTVKKKVIQIEFDAEMLIAFAYNIDYSDEFLRVSCEPIRWLNDNGIRKKFDSDSEKRKYKSMREEYLADKLCRCTVFVTYSLNKRNIADLYNITVSKVLDKAKELNSYDPEIIKKAYLSDEFSKDFNKSLSSGFHPSQVAKYYGENPDYTPKDKKKKHKHKK